MSDTDTSNEETPKPSRTVFRVITAGVMLTGVAAVGVVMYFTLQVQRAAIPRNGPTPGREPPLQPKVPRTPPRETTPNNRAPTRIPGPPAVPGGTVGLGTTLRPFDRTLLALGSSKLGGADESIVYAEGTVVVTAFRDRGQDTVSRATVDLDQDGYADEEWTYGANDRVLRHLSHEDDGEFVETVAWSEDLGWIRVRQ